MDEPKELERPELAIWMFRKGRKAADLAAAINKSVVTAGRYILPFEHPQYRRPDAEDMLLILDWTYGEITAEHYYPHALRSVRAAAPAEGRPADEDYAPVRNFLEAESSR